MYAVLLAIPQSINGGMQLRHIIKPLSRGAGFLRYHSRGNGLNTVHHTLPWKTHTLLTLLRNMAISNFWYDSHESTISWLGRALGAYALAPQPSEGWRARSHEGKYIYLFYLWVGGGDAGQRALRLQCSGQYLCSASSSQTWFGFFVTVATIAKFSLFVCSVLVLSTFSFYYNWY